MVLGEARALRSKSLSCSVRVAKRNGFWRNAASGGMAWSMPPYVNVGMQFRDPTSKLRDANLGHNDVGDGERTARQHSGPIDGSGVTPGGRGISALDRPSSCAVAKRLGRSLIIDLGHLEAKKRPSRLTWQEIKKRY